MNLTMNQNDWMSLAHRIRKTFSDTASPFTGPVEVDETYMSGRRANMPRSKREKLAGRGAVGAKNPTTNQVAAQVVESTDKPTLHAFVAPHAAPEPIVYTDDALVVYESIPNPHEAVNHSALEYVRGDVHTNGMKSFWSMLKRAHKGIYHKISPKHLDRYVQEFASRHNLQHSRCAHSNGRSGSWARKQTVHIRLLEAT